jgi:transposase
MKPTKIFEIIAPIFMVLAIQLVGSYVHYNMQDATPSSTETQQPTPSIEMLLKENAQLKDKLAWMESEYQKLTKLFTAQLYKKSEKHISPGGSPWLPFESQEEFQQARLEAEAEAQKLVDEHEAKEPIKPRKPRNESLPKHLPEVKKLCDVPECDRVCPEHGPMSVIGFDTTETLVEEPAKLYRVVTEYPKYACSCCKVHGIVTAERPTSLVEGNKYDTSIGAAIVVHKHDLHLPLYRQTDIFAASGWTPSRSTLLNILRQVDFVVFSFVAFMASKVQADFAVGLDESSCRMLMPTERPVVEPGDLKAQRLAEKFDEAKAEGKDSILGKMWAYRGLDQAPYNIFDFRISRHRDGPDEFFRNSHCVVQGDCFSGNTSVVIQSNERLQFAACWAHARRYVYDVNKENKHRKMLLDMIQLLYDANAREQGMDAAARTAHRQENSVPVLTAIKKYIDSLTDQVVLPKSDLADALRYLRNHWGALTLYATDGRIPIDNNRVEQLMREVALGRKNWLFVGNVEAGERSARLMSIVSSAKRHQLDVRLYIKDLLDRLLAGETDYSKLLPDVWKREHPEAVRVYREEESRYKSDRKQLDRARRIIAAKQKRTEKASQPS